MEDESFAIAFFSVIGVVAAAGGGGGDDDDTLAAINMTLPLLVRLRVGTAN